MLYNQMVIAWDGRAGLCCEDIFLEEYVGNVTKSSLKEIYNSNRYMQIRKLHEKGKTNKVDLCKDCDIWASGIELGKKEVTMDGIRILETKRVADTLYTREKRS